MYISTEIMKEVERKEEQTKNFNRCIDVQICPKCGGPLEKKATDDPNFIDFTYTCHKCKFEHTKLGA